MPRRLRSGIQSLQASSGSAGLLLRCAVPITPPIGGCCGEVVWAELQHAGSRAPNSCPRVPHKTEKRKGQMVIHAPLYAQLRSGIPRTGDGSLKPNLAFLPLVA